METQTQQKTELNMVTKKVLVIVAIALLLIIPLIQVQDQIVSRRDYEKVAQQEVAKGWGGDITLSSPTAAYAGYWINPEKTETTIKIDSQEKVRGTFQVPVYTATVKSVLNFKKPVSKDDKKDVQSNNPDYLKLWIKPTASIQSIKIKESATGKELKPRMVEDGLRIAIDEFTDKSYLDNKLEIEFTVRGTGQLSYHSYSDTETVTMSGNWPKPKFVEDILPTESNLSAEGFSASWTLNSLSTWEETTRKPKSIGLTHLWIGTDYTMLEKAVKYGTLFIALTFLLVFVVEFISKMRIHPLQYGMIGISISVFYLLLLAISETIGFDIAYAISSLAVTGLIGFYVKGFLNQKKFVRMILIEQITLSGFFYVLISLEERAFLVGSIGLFTALAVFMSITRKFDWYAGLSRNQSNG